ncbi:MAG: 2-C-methyl-D-erythritol 2,4-cyclodiphosphate synthase [Gemmatimonadota bacterium]
MRVGLGYDSHRFDPATPCWLGGVLIPDHPGLAGHSDGDAICHAVIDAVLGAAALGDVGSHFPPTDETWAGADSLELLRRAVEVLERENYQVVNVDVTVICETPKIGPVAEAIRERLGDALRVGPGFVSVKGKTNEGLGWIGAGEGLAVHAVALVDRVQEGDAPAPGR